jgi:hypothetical protein
MQVWTSTGTWPIGVANIPADATAMPVSGT